MTTPASARRSAGFSALLAAVLPTLSAQQANEVSVDPEATTGLLQAQGSDWSDAGALTAIHTAPADGGVGYGVWGAGPGYKVSFHGDATFVPYLGKDYPHNQPWAWRTQSITLGGVELVTQAPRLGYGEHRAEYRLGGAVEAWDLRAGGVEQTFVIPQRVAVGELVVHGVVQSMLQAVPAAPAHRSLSFVDGNGLELVSYGAATAVDANGDRRAMTTTCENGRITLRLDAAWLDTAAFPVVVDPLVGPGASAGGNSRYEIDSVRCAETSVEPNWVAYTAYASLTDADLYFRRWEDDGSLGSNPFNDITASWSTRNPAVGYNADANRGVVAFDRYFPSSSTRGVRVHSHLRSDYTNSTSYDALPSTGNAWRPDVGGTRNNTSGPEVLVVFQEEVAGTFQNSNSSAIRGVVYDTASGATSGNFAIIDSLFSDNERPSVNQTSADTGPGTGWVVAYQSKSTLSSNDDLDVYVRQVDRSATVSSAVAIDAGFIGHQWAPKVEGAYGRYLVACVAGPHTILAPQNANGHQIRATRLDWSNGGNATTPHGTWTVQSNGDARNLLGGLAFDRNSRSHWAILAGSTVTGNLYLHTVGFRGRNLQLETVFNAGSGQSGKLGGVSFDAFNNAFAIAYAYNTSGTDYTRTDRFVYPLVFAPSTAGTACSPATIEWYGSQQIGSELGGVRVIGAANDSLHVALLAVAPVSAPLFNVAPIQNGCWLLVANTGNDYLGMFGLKVGSTVSWNLPLPEFLPTDTYYMQDWHTVGNGNFDFVSTQRLAVPTAR